MSVIKWLEGREESSFLNVVIVYLLFAAAFASFFYGGYHTLKPTFFLVGFFISSVVCVWASMTMRFTSLLVLLTVALGTAAIDEYIHTSTGTFTYFDLGLPSPLTVFGWGLFILGILTIAKIINQIISKRIQDDRMERIAPTVTIISLLLVSMGVQRYLPVISWLLAVVYALMVGASIYYTRQNPAGWNVSVMISSLFVGATMESLGAWEGLWHFHYMEPLSAFMAFTWTLRTWTILTICSLLGARFDT